MDHKLNKHVTMSASYSHMKDKWMSKGGWVLDPNWGYSNSDDYKICDCCGQRTWYDDGEWVDDNFLCPNCIEAETFVCEECGERYFNSARKYDKTKEKFVCSDCYVEEEL